MKRNDSQIKKMKYVVSACVVLHNFCEMRGLDYLEEEEEEAELEQPETEPDLGAAALPEGEEIRGALVAHI